MNKIESARIIVKQKGNCIKVLCAECFNREMCTKLYEDGKDVESSHKLALAESYIKRHEQKSKKKNHIRDAKKEVDSYAKKMKKYYVQDLKPVTLVEDKVEEPKPTPLEIAKMIRDNGYKFDCKYNETGCGDCKASGFCDTGGCCRKDVIDDYISANEPKPVKKVGIDNDDVTFAKPTVKENLSVPCKYLINGYACGSPFDYCDKDCPANSEIPQPIKFDDPVPDKLYIAYSSFIRCYVVVGGFKKVIDKEMDGSTRETFSIYARPITDGTAEWLTGKECYRTIGEAIIVAKKLWQGEGK